MDVIKHKYGNGNRKITMGVATRLLLAFLGVTLMTVLVAVIGYQGMRDSGQTLGSALDSFDRVSVLIDNTTRSLDHASATLANASDTLDATVATMGASSDGVNRLNSVDLPAVIAIGAIREALTAVAVGERTLLMRQLYDPAIRDEMRASIDAAFDRAEAALALFAEIENRLDNEKRSAWQQFLASWKAWEKAHDEMMIEFDAIDELLAKRVRGGFEFEAVAKRAFDIAFGDGQTARDAVNQRLDAVVALISASARSSALKAGADANAAAVDARLAKDAMRDATLQIDDFQSRMATVNQQVKSTTGATQSSLMNSARVRVFFIVCSLLGLVVSVLLALWQTRYLSRPIRHAAEQMDLLAKGEIDHDILTGYASRTDEIGALARSVAEMLDSLREEVDIARDMASGDFSGTVRLRGDRDKLGHALSTMMRITHDTLSRVNRHVRQVTDGAASISGVSQSLSSGATRTAEALVEITATMNQIGEQTHDNAKNAAQANEFAIASRQVAERGYVAVEEMVTSMHEIQTSSAKIAQIVKLIDDIAFQTNLLALNAAVEAARAGRQGKGFSVVAEEVRNLASRSAKAARETATLVEDTVERVENGVAIAGRTDEAFKEILDNAQRTANLYGKIAFASQEQSTGIDQVVQGLAQIDQLTHENSHYASETARAAQQLSRQSSELREMMVRFQLQERSARVADEPDGFEAGRDIRLPRPEDPPQLSGGGVRRLLEMTDKER